MIGLEGFLPTIQEGLALSEMEAADRAMAIREGRAEAFDSQPYKDAFGDALNNAGTRAGVNPVSAGYAAVGLGLDALNIGTSQINDKLNATFRSDADIQAKRQRAEQVAFEQVEALTQVSRELAKLPPNLASQEFQDAVDSGNYFTAAQLAPSAAYYVSLQNAPTLAAQAAISAATAAITKNPTAIRTVMGATGALGESTEISNDYMDVLSRLSPEEQADPSARFAAFKTAAESTLARMAVGAVVPAGLASGTGNIARDVAQVTALNVAQEMGGEAIASDIRGADYTAGSLLLEGLGGLGGGVAEGGGMVWNDYRENKLGRNLTRSLQEQADEATANLVRDNERRDAEQRLAEANREAFDAEVEADRAIQEILDRKASADQLNNATQTEMPFGSDLTPGENDRTPTIQDMFTGESVAATKAEQQREANKEEAGKLAKGERTLTEDEFELQSQRTTAAKDSIDNRKQADFETEEQSKEKRRTLLAEDQTILKNERQLQSTADITREAQRRLEIEKEEIRRKPENRRGVRNARLTETLDAYERKRRPELVAQVRAERLKRIVEARDRTIAEENRNVALDDIAVQADLDARSEARLAKEREDTLDLPTDLFSTPEVKGQQELLSGEISQQPARPTYTGTLTEKQAQQEAAALLLARQKAKEDTRPKAQAKATEEEVAAAEQLAREVDAELPTIEKILAKAQTKAANLTVKAYAQKEAKAQEDFIKEAAAKEGATLATVKVEAASRMAEWRKANPKPAAAPEVTAATDKLVKQAEKIQKDREKAEKVKETKNLTKALKREMATGKTPAEAAEAVNRELSKEEDADVRAELAGATTANPTAATGTATRRRYGDAVRQTTPDGKGVFFESTGLRAALDKVMASDSRTKPGDLLRAILAHPEASRGEKWLANRLVGLIDNLDIKLIDVPTEPETATWGGAFIPSKNATWIRVATAEVILHELLHAVTSNVISSKAVRANPKIAAAVRQLNDVLAAVQLAYGEQQGSISGRLATILSNKQGPLSNTTELVSYALTEDVFMEWLETVPMPGPKKTAWQGFKDAIKSIFTPRNAEQNTALDEILDATSSLTMVQEQTPAVNAWASSEAKSKATRVNPQSIPGLLGNEESRKNTLNKTLAQLSSMYKNLAKAIAATARDSTLGDSLAEFRDSAFETPIEEMANRTIENADLTTYRQKLGQLPRNLAKWAGLENKMVTEDGELMPLFHGSRVQTGANGKSFSAFRMPVDSGQLGIHATVAPQVATTFNKKAGEMGLMSQADDALYVMAGRMSNPLRLRDFGLWDARAILVSLRKSTNPQEIRLAKELRRLQDALEEGGVVADADTREAILNAGFDGIVYLNRMEMGLTGVVTDKVAGPRLDKLGIPLLPLDGEQRGFYNTTQGQNAARVTITLNSLSDEDFSKVFPEAAESYIFLKPQDVKSVTDNDGEFSESSDIYASDAGDVEITEDEAFTNPVSKKVFFGPGGKIRPEWGHKGTIVEAVFDSLSAGGGKIDYTKGVRSSIAEIFERSGSEAGALIAEAEGYFKAMDGALYRQARKAKQDTDAYRTGFSSAVAEFEKLGEGLSKSQKAKDLTTKYGNAAKAYFQARAKIDSMSAEILQQRLDDPRPFTEAEAKIYRSIKENMGRYYSRVYAASTKGIGTKRAKKLWKEFEEYAAGTPNAEFKDGYDIIRNAIQYVSKNHLIVPDVDTLEEMSLTELQDMATAWGIRTGGLADIDNPLTAPVRKERLIEELSKFADATPAVRQQQARVLVEQLLFSRAHAALNKFYRGQSQDLTIVSEKKAVPEEIRKLLGEYEDLPLKAMTTMIRMATFRSTTKAFSELLASQKGKTILTADQVRERDLSPQEWSPLSGETYGPLNGMYVRKDLLANIESSMEITRTFDQLIGMGEQGSAERIKAAAFWGVEKWIGFAAGVKMLQLVANISNAGLNYGGGVVSTIGNGNLNAKAIAKAHGIATSLIAAQTSSHSTPEMLKVIRAGITDNAMLGSIRKVEAEKLNEVLFAHLESPIEKKRSKAQRGLAAGGRVWRETYAMADVVWKIANFLEEERKLTAFYKAEGIEISAEEIERRAAWNTNQSNFSYKRVPSLIKDIEKGGITYVMPYVYETFRAPIGNIFVGLSDLKKASEAKTTEGKKIMMASGVRRVVGGALAMGVMQMAMHATAQMIAENFGGEDEEWTNKLRVFMPDYKKFADLIYLGDNSEGEAVILEFSRLDPFGPSTEFFRMAVAGAEPEEYLQAAKNLLIVNPYGRGMVQAFFGQGGTNTRMQEITPEFYSKLVNAFEWVGMDGLRGAKAIDLLLPSAIVRPFDPGNKPVENEIFTSMFTALGGQLHNIDPNKSVKFATDDFSRVSNEIRGDFYTLLKTDTDLDDNQLLSKMVDLRERERDNFKKLQALHDGMIDIGYTPQEVMADLASRRVSPTNLAMLNMGGYVPEGSGIVSVRGLKQSWSQVNASPIGDDRKNTYYNNILRTLQLAESGQIPVRE
jgi:hypothetical protein